MRIRQAAIIGLPILLSAGVAQALEYGGRLLLTGGVNTIEGAAGGGLTPWAVIGGYGTRDQIGGNAFFSHVEIDDYRLEVRGAVLGLFDRVELSFAEQRFDTRQVGAALGLGAGFTFRQEVFGAKIRLAGDAVLDQDLWMPQIAFGVEHKRNNRGAILRAIGARDDEGTDYYLSATKLFLAQSTLLNATLRATKANQAGILGFGGDRRDSYRIQPEFSLAYLLNRHLAIGGEYRFKPNNLGIAKEDDWWDLFVAWAPNKHLSLTLAYVDLGNIVIRDRQSATYLSLQVGF
ncbi:MAG: hypothetical protein KatS3mg125_0389 [Lysobacterales bacterium]|jgi:hypothetical protein|nr:MAG: hypothetical protein KatS3mg125_0389 [Xanthomonadales bacterium]